MEDQTIASTEVSTPETSGVNAPAPASGNGDSTSSVTTPTPEATSTEVAQNPGGQTDLGYSLDDLGLGDEPAVAEDDEYSDEKLDQMAKEPGLDPAKTPGLVEVIRKMREQHKLGKQQLAERDARESDLRAQLDALADYGGVEGVKTTLGVIAPLLRNEEGSATNFLTAVWENAQPAYAQLADAVLQLTDQKYILERLQSLGKLPDTLTTSQATAPALDAETLATIPENLREIAQNLGVKQPKVLEDLLLQPEEVRNFNLEREKKLADMDARQEAQARADWDSKVQAAQSSGYEAIQRISQQHEQRHYAELAKWKPFGENASANESLHRDVLEGAYSTILQQPEYLKMQEDAQRMLREAPLLKLQGETYKAAEYERQAGLLAARFNVRLGQVLTERIKGENGYARVFDDARKWREQQRQGLSSRTEVPGQTAALSNQNSSNGTEFKGATRDQNGQLTPEFRAHLNALVPTAA